MKTAVIYARYSCDKQNEQSIEGQLHVCYEYAERNNIVIVDKYIDRATSGTNDHRPAFQKMLRDSDKKGWDYVIVYKLDRFSRNKYEMAMHKKHLKDNGIKILSATENIPDTPEGIILESLLEGMAEYYSAELSQKILRGLHESRSKGLYTGGIPPFGYKVVNHRLVIVEEEAEVVRYMYNQIASGVKVADLIQKLKEQGVMYRGKFLTNGLVYKILRSERYTGVATIHGERYDKLFPRIIDDKLFEDARRVLTAKLHHGKESKVEQPFKDKIYCGYCKKPMILTGGVTRKGTLHTYYTCTGKFRTKNCKAALHRREYTEEYLLSIVNKTFGTKRNITFLAETVIKVHKQRRKEKSVLNRLEKDKLEMQKSMRNLLHAMEEGIITSSTKKRMAELESQLEDINKKIDKEQKHLDIEIPKDEVKAYIKEALQRGGREMIFMLVDKIYVYDDKIELHYNFQKYKGPGDNHQGLLLYKGESRVNRWLPNKYYHKNTLDETTIELYVYYG